MQVLLDLQHLETTGIGEWSDKSMKPVLQRLRRRGQLSDLEPHCSPLDFIPSLRLEWMRAKQCSSRAGKAQGNLSSPERHQTMCEVPSANQLSLGKVNPAHTI